jgi:hypothetical protein
VRNKTKHVHWKILAGSVNTFHLPPVIQGFSCQSWYHLRISCTRFMSSGAPPPLPVSKLPQETEALSYTRMEPVFYEVQVSNQARQRVRMIPIHNRPGINELFHIKGHFLSILRACPAAELPRRAPAKRENQFSWLLNPATRVSGAIFGAG